MVLLCENGKNTYFFIYIYLKNKDMKTKMTISIDKELLKKFDNWCDENSVNKSKYICNIISKNINEKIKTEK